MDAGNRPDTFDFFQSAIRALWIGLINGQPVPLQTLVFHKSVSGEIDKVEFDYKKNELIV